MQDSLTIAVLQHPRHNHPSFQTVSEKSRQCPGAAVDTSCQALSLLLEGCSVSVGHDASVEKENRYLLVNPVVGNNYISGFMDGDSSFP